MFKNPTTPFLRKNNSSMTIYPSGHSQIRSERVHPIVIRPRVDVLKLSLKAFSWPERALSNKI